MADSFDVFISYAHADYEWVKVLANNLHQSGLTVFFDEWEIGPGDVLVHKLDAGILNARNGALIVSPTALSRPGVQEEYAAMMTRVVAGQQHLIPVLLADADMPPMLASRVWVDFRHAHGPAYEAKVRELVRMLKGEKSGPPPRTGTLQPAPGSAFRPQGPLRRRLSISRTEVALLGDGAPPVTHQPRGIDHVTDVGSDQDPRRYPPELDYVIVHGKITASAMWKSVKASFLSGTRSLKFNGSNVTPTIGKKSVVSLNRRCPRC